MKKEWRKWRRKEGNTKFFAVQIRRPIKKQLNYLKLQKQQSKNNHCEHSDQHLKTERTRAIRLWYEWLNSSSGTEKSQEIKYKTDTPKKNNMKILHKIAIVTWRRQTTTTPQGTCCRCNRCLSDVTSYVLSNLQKHISLIIEKEF